MAHHKSAIKRIKTSERDKERNFSYRSRLKTLKKYVLSSKNLEEGRVAFSKITSYLDKLVHKKIIHKNKAANQKSKLARAINKLA